MEKTLRLSAEQREDLVAYLDGELPDQKAQLIDQVLARSEVARHEVEALARTWEMLDVLPTPKAPSEKRSRRSSGRSTTVGAAIAAIVGPVLPMNRPVRVSEK